MRILGGLRQRQLVKAYIEYIVDVPRLFDVLGSTSNARQNEEFQSVAAISNVAIIGGYKPTLATPNRICTISPIDSGLAEEGHALLVRVPGAGANIRAPARDPASSADLLPSRPAAFQPNPLSFHTYNIQTHDLL